MNRFKESTVICLAITSVLFSIIMFLCFDTKIRQLEYEINHLSMELKELDVEVGAELAEHEDRIDLIEHNYDVLKIRVGRHYQKLTELSDLVEDHQELLAKPTPTPKAASNTTVKGKKVSVKVSQRDIRNIAALVYLEAGSCSYKCQKAIASVVFNRMMRYHKTATQVIWEKGVFTVSGKVSKTKPSQSCLNAVNDVLVNGTTLPLRVTAFRNRRYHNFGTRYCCIDGVYFTKV